MAVYSVCGVAGPAAVGVVSTAWGPLFSLAALAAGGLVGGLVVWRLPEGAPREPGLRRPAGTGRPRWAGVSAVLRDPWLSAATMASSLAQVGLGALGVVVAVLASREQRTVVAVLLLAALPCGALLGSLSWMWRPGAPDLAPTLVVWGQLAVGVPIAVSAAVAQPVVVALLLAVAGVTLGRSTGALFLTRERRSPADAAGQVFAVGAGLKLACGAVGAVSVGLVADVDARWLLLACGAVPIVASVVGGLALRSRRGYAAVVP